RGAALPRVRRLRPRLDRGIQVAPGAQDRGDEGARAAPRDRRGPGPRLRPAGGGRPAHPRLRRHPGDRRHRAAAGAAPPGRPAPDVKAPFLVFDLDGTLIDGYDAIGDALAHAMGKFGLAPLPTEEVRVLVGHGIERLLEKAVGPGRAAEGVRLFRERYPDVA